MHCHFLQSISISSHCIAFDWGERWQNEFQLYTVRCALLSASLLSRLHLRVALSAAVTTLTSCSTHRPSRFSQGHFCRASAKVEKRRWARWWGVWRPKPLMILRITRFHRASKAVMTTSTAWRLLTAVGAHLNPAQTGQAQRNIETKVRTDNYGLTCSYKFDRPGSVSLDRWWLLSRDRDLKSASCSLGRRRRLDLERGDGALVLPMRFRNMRFVRAWSTTVVKLRSYWHTRPYAGCGLNPFLGRRFNGRICGCPDSLELKFRVASLRLAGIWLGKVDGLELDPVYSFCEENGAFGCPATGSRRSICSTATAGR